MSPPAPLHLTERDVATIWSDPRPVHRVARNTVISGADLRVLLGLVGTGGNAEAPRLTDGDITTTWSRRSRKGVSE